MFAKQALHRRAHGLHVQPIVQTPGAVQMERGRRGAIEDAIFIHPGAAVAARVEGIRDDLDFFDRDVFRRQCVESALDAVRIETLVRMEIDDLPQRMHARVGAPRPCHTDGLSQKCQNRSFENRLDGFAVGLDLPAVVIRPIVFDGEFDIHGERACFAFRVPIWNLQPADL